MLSPMNALPCLTCGGLAVSRAADPLTGDCPRCGVVEIAIGKRDGQQFEAYSRESHEAWESHRADMRAGRVVFDDDDCPGFAALYAAHPDEAPEPSRPLPYLIDPPSRLSSSSAWRRYRDETLRPLIASMPDDVDLPRFLACADAVLAWRSHVAPSDRFWKAD